MNEFKLKKLFVWETLHDKIKDGDAVLSKTITVTAAQLRVAVAVPIEILPAPGAGKAYLALYGYSKFVPGSVQYDGNTGLYVGAHSWATIASMNEQQLTGVFAGVATPRPEPYLSMLTSQKPSGFGTDSIKENESLNLYRGETSTVGDGTMEVTIFYRILSL